MNDNSGVPASNFAALRDWLAKQRLQGQADGPILKNSKPSSTAQLMERTSADPQPMFSVSPDGSADFTDITSAVRKAPTGSRILVRPGRYQEGIILEKPLEIVGDGSRQDIVIENPDTHCVLMQASHGAVRGLTLRSQGSSKGNKRSAVYIVQGTLLVEECTLSSDTLAAISILGHSARPTLRGCRFVDSRSSGLLVADHATATIEECEFLDNGEAGLLIRNEGNPVVRHCQFHNGKMFGLMVDQGGRGTIEECEFFKNDAAGVEISGGNPFIRNFTVHH